MSEKKNQGGKSNFGAKGWTIVLISVLYFYLSTAVTSDGANTINAVMQQKFGLTSLAPLTLGQTLGGWLTILTIPVFTMLANKSGVKNVILVALAIFAVCTYFIFNAPTVGVYQVAVTVACATLVGFSMVGTGQLGANWFPTKKGLYMGWATFGIPIAAASVNLMMSKMMEVMPFENIAWFFIVLAVLAIVLTVVFVKNNPEEAGAYPDNDQSMTPEKAAERVWKSMLYQVVKYIGSMATALHGEVDGILLGGGMVYDESLVQAIKDGCEWIAPVYPYPGEFEMEAMAAGATRALDGVEKTKEYTGIPSWTGFED